MTGLADVLRGLAGRDGVQGALLLMLFKQPPQPRDADNPVRVGFGAPCPADLWEPFEARFGVRLVDVYGMTEIAIATANSLEHRRIGTAGSQPEPSRTRTTKSAKTTETRANGMVSVFKSSRATQ